MEAVTVDRLFRVRQKVDLRGIVLNVRALTDLEVYERSRLAMAASMRAQQRLRDHASDDYLASIVSLERLEDETLRSICTTNHSGELGPDIYREFPLAYIPFPDNPTEDESRDVLAKREEAEKKLIEKRVGALRERLEKYSQTIAEKPREWLLKEAARLVERAVVEAAFEVEHDVQSLYLSVETLEGEHYFKNLEEARAIPASVRVQLMTVLRGVNDLDPLALSLPSSTG